LSSAETVYLADLRPEPAIESEMAWYWNVARETGEKSNFLAMVQRCMEGAPKGTVSRAPSDGFDGKQVAIAGHRREIERALEMLSAEQQGVLRDAFRAQLLVEAVEAELPAGLEPPERKKRVRAALKALAPYGPLAGLVILAPATRATHVASKSKRSYVDWLARLARPGAGAHARNTCGALKREAEARLNAATRAYAAAAKQWRKSARLRAESLEGVE
jgi:hypothetical protein